MVHLTLRTQELCPPSSSDVLSHELCRFCALPLLAALIFGAEVMPRSRTSVGTELLPWEELGVTHRGICAKIVCTVQKKTLSCTDSPTAGNSRVGPWHSLGEGAGQDLLGGPAVMPARGSPELVGSVPALRLSPFQLTRALSPARDALLS